jgi:quercetin dioxygenase-like cupin family protein
MVALPTTNNRRISLSSTTKRSHSFDQGEICARSSVLIIIFTFGMAVGAQLWGSPSLLGPHDAGTSKEPARQISGSIHHLGDTPIRRTAHKDEHGRAITKQQFIEPFVIPNVAGYSVATMLPGQKVESHEHSTMHEFFYILQGTAVFTIDGKDTPVKPGTFLHLAPHELHGIFVPPDSADGEMKMLLSGIVVEDR